MSRSMAPPGRSGSFMNLNHTEASTPRRMQAVGVSPRYVDQTKKARAQKVKEMKKRHLAQVASTKGIQKAAATAASPNPTPSSGRKKSKKGEASKPASLGPDYGSMTIKELRAKATEMGVDTKGKKKDLVKRLEALVLPEPEVIQAPPKKKKQSKSSRKALAAMVSPRMSRSNLQRADSAADMMMRNGIVTLETKVGSSAEGYLDEVRKSIKARPDDLFGDEIEDDKKRNSINALQDLLSDGLDGSGSSDDSDDEFYNVEQDLEVKKPQVRETEELSEMKDLLADGPDGDGDAAPDEPNIMAMPFATVAGDDGTYRGNADGAEGDDEEEEEEETLERPKLDWETSAFRNAKNLFINAGGDPTSEVAITKFYTHSSKAFGRLDDYLDEKFAMYMTGGLAALKLDEQIETVLPGEDGMAQLEKDRQEAEARAAEAAEEDPMDAGYVHGADQAMDMLRWQRLEGIFLETMMEERDYYYREKPDVQDMDEYLSDLVKEFAEVFERYTLESTADHMVDDWMVETVNAFEETEADPFYDALLVDAGLA